MRYRTKERAGGRKKKENRVRRREREREREWKLPLEERKERATD